MSLARLRTIREHPASVAPRSLTSELTSALDGAIVEIASDLDLSDAAIVATGGYGSGRQCLHSDVDVMVVRDRPVSGDAVRALLDPLWSAGLRVGHSVRKPREAVDLAKEDVATLSSLLTMRRLAGDPAIVEELESRLGRLANRRRPKLLATWAEEEALRRNAEPYRAMSANLKTGRGGVRTLQTLSWERRLAQLAGESTATSEEELEWWASITALRNALHATAGRAHDRYDFDLRLAAAQWFGVSPAELGSELLRTTREIEEAVTGLFPEQLRRPRTATRLASVPVPTDETIGLAVHAAVAARPLTPAETATAATAPPPRWSRSDVRGWLYLLEPGWARVVLRQLMECGWLGRVFPEWLALRDLPHIVPFHSHPVADHLLRTVDELGDVIAEPGQPLDRIGADDEQILRLAAWLHDVGKPGPGDHSIVGAVLAAEIAGRLRLHGGEARMLVTLVEHHLLLPDLATRHDVSDDALMAEALDAIGSRKMLDLLYLLSVADSRATGPGAWTNWKADLLQRAHRAATDALEARTLATPVLADLVAAVVAEGVPEAAIRQHLDLIPFAERSGTSPPAMATHVALASPPPLAGEVRFRYRTIGATTQLTLCTRDTEGLLATAAGVLALHNVSVLDARLLTRRDGVVIDHFEIIDALSEGPIADGRLKAAQRDLVAAIGGTLDLAASLAEKQHAYRSRVRAGIEPVVALQPRPAGFLVEVEGADRLGLLHDLARVMGRHAMDIRRARIDTRGGVAVDAFYAYRGPADPDGLRRDLIDVF